MSKNSWRASIIFAFSISLACSICFLKLEVARAKGLLTFQEMFDKMLDVFNDLKGGLE